jgi:hypothetical protein
MILILPLPYTVDNLRRLADDLIPRISAPAPVA